MDAHGAKLILGYQNERAKGSVEKLVQELGQAPIALVPCDVTLSADMMGVRDTIKEQAGRIDGFVHCLAFAPKEALEEPYLCTTRDAFLTAMEVSTYSLVALAQSLEPLIVENGSVITLTYYGSEKVIPNYNVMGVAKAALEASVRYLAHDLGQRGVRVNAISAGPINTVAARGVSGFLDILDVYADKAP